MSVLLFIFVVLVGYLAGSVCSAVIVSQAFALPDPRKEGSKNPGATNVLRLAGKKYAAIVMVVDVLKGLLPVLLAKLLGASSTAVAFTALAAVLGHMFPLFFQFQGGKGVATALGALIGFHFTLGISVAATWLIVANVSRYSSLASMSSMVLAPFYSLFLGNDIESFPPLFFMSLAILYKHRQNISRLIDGVEPKIKLKATAADELLETELSDDVKTTPMKKAAKKPAAKKTTAKTSTAEKTTAKKTTAKKASTAKKPAAKKTTAKKTTAKKTVTEKK